MTVYKKNRSIKGCTAVFLTLFLTVALLAQFANAQTQAPTTNNPWGITLQTQKVGQNSTSSIFAPFDQIQLNATVTYNNATQPDMLVSFQIQGPNVTNPVKITRIETTNPKGIASFPFRLPIESNDRNAFIGIWQATAAVQTTNGTIQKSLNFTTQWPIQINALNLLNNQNQSQQVFAPSDLVLVDLSVRNLQPQTANITIEMSDSGGKIINSTQLPNQQLESSNATQIRSFLQIPQNASFGQTTIKVAIYSGSFQNVDIPIAESQIANLVITHSGTSTVPPTMTPMPTPTLEATPTATATPPPTMDNSIGLFSWSLVAAGLFTFTALIVFLRRKPLLKINTQIPSVSTPTPNQTMATTTSLPVELPQNAPLAATVKVTPTKTTQITIEELPNIYQTLGIPPIVPTSNSDNEANKANKQQPIANQLAKISIIGQKVQNLETELKLQKEQLNKEITVLSQSLEEQEKAIKNYFDTIRLEMAKLTGEKTPDKKQETANKDNN